MSHDRITLTGVRARGFHGVLPEERRDGQIFVVDVDLVLDLAPAAEADDLALTVDYADVAALVVAEITGPACDLVEALASRIAGRLLDDPQVEQVVVAVHKPQAPVGVPFDDVTVSVSRSRR